MKPLREATRSSWVPNEAWDYNVLLEHGETQHEVIFSKENQKW